MQHEVCGLRWGDLSCGDYGAALLSDAKYGYSARGGRLALTLLRAPKAPDPHADMGVHHFRYALLPHLGPVAAGGEGGADVLAAAAQLNAPLLWPLGGRSGDGAAHARLPPVPARVTAAARALAHAAGSGTHPSALALFRVTPPASIVLDTVKLAQDGSGDVIVRLYEAVGACAARARLDFAFPVASVEVGAECARGAAHLSCLPPRLH